MSGIGDGKAPTGKVAIIGMSCLFPGAPNLAAFWSNIVRGVDSITEVTDAQWDQSDYYDPNSTTYGKSYSRRGGFIADVAEFDPLKFGVMPTALAGSDPDQFLTLKVAHEAIADAGYADRPFNRDRTELILGRISAPGAGSMNLIQQGKTIPEIVRILRSILPEESSQVIDEVSEQLHKRLQPCTSDNMPGVMPNILAGRVAAKLGLRGRNLLIDAACASSMVAIETAVNDLLSRQCDLALAGGVHVNSSAVFFNLFCGLGALSRKDTIRPFDEEADGTLLGEGIGIICLKRYEEAVADGDRIYATICGVGSSSDGFGGSVIAPSIDGEALAMQNAYDMAGVSPTTVELLEAHGTGTATGDFVELQAVAKVFGFEDEPWCALGTIKSMIGHCQSASAVAGVIKAALALHHKVLPPTLNVQTPSSRVDWSKHPCYVNTEARPWIRTERQIEPRRAAVSAFGFGGINAHAVLEEHRPAAETAVPISLHQTWNSEVFVFTALNRKELASSIRRINSIIEHDQNVSLKDLAYTLNCLSDKTGDNTNSVCRMAIVATSRDDLTNKLNRSLDLISSQAVSGLNLTEADRAIQFTEVGSAIGGKLAFLYPGLGSAYTNMLRDLCVHFPEVREVFEIVDNVALRAGAPFPPSRAIFPTPANLAAQGSTSLAEADFAVVAVLLAEYSLHELLRHLEIKPDALMGVSTGEFAALTTGGAIQVLRAADTFYKLSTNLTRSIPTDAASDLRSIRVLASAETVEPLYGEDVHLSADLGDDHIMLTGSSAAIERLCQELRSARLAFQVLPNPSPYHTPLVGNLIKDSDVEAVEVTPLSVPTWSCSTATKFSKDVAEIRTSLTRLFAKPVSLRKTILGMYAEGVRKFVEVGPNGVLTALANSILRDQPHVVVASNLASKDGLTQLHTMLSALFVHGVHINFEYLYARRNPTRIDTAARTSAPRRHVLGLTHTALKVDAATIPLASPLLPATLQTATRDAHHEPDQANVLQSFLSTNASFYSQMNHVQEQVVKAFFEQVSEENPDSIVESDIDSDLPFLSRFEISYDEHATNSVIDISLNSDLYLLDHAIGGNVATSPELRVHLMPLMVALEIMAEAAFAHVREGVVVRLEQVKALRRIVVDDAIRSLRLVANGTMREIHVELFQDDDSDAPSMVADFKFADQYKSAPPAKLKVTGSPARNLTSHQRLYNTTAMFHGSSMQSVRSIESIDNRGISGIASARAADGWFTKTSSPRFLLDPLLLDNASQFVLFHLYENELESTALLPFFIEAIDLFGDPMNLHVNGVVQVSARLSTLTERATAADVEIQDSHGRLAIAINSINSRRVVLVENWKRIVRDPSNEFLCQVVPTEYGGTVLTRIMQTSLPEDDTILDWCADYLLTRSERDYWRQHSKTQKRRIDWLMGRIAAKDAIRHLVQDETKVSLAPCDIEISYSETRVPIVTINGYTGVPDIYVSISHGAGMAVAFAAIAQSPGIDVECIAPIDIELSKTFLTPTELDAFQKVDAATRDLQLTKVWSAKEAVFKALKGRAEMQELSLASPAEHAQHEKITLTFGADSFVVQTRQIEPNLVMSYTIT